MFHICWKLELEPAKICNFITLISNWRKGYPVNSDFYAAMRQSDGKWSTGIGKAEMRFFCLKAAIKKEIIGIFVYK